MVKSLCALLFWVIFCDLACNIPYLAEVMNLLGNEIGVDGVMGDDTTGGSCILF